MRNYGYGASVTRPFESRHTCKVIKGRTTCVPKTGMHKKSKESQLPSRVDRAGYFRPRYTSLY